MDDLSKIPEETKVQITMNKGDWAVLKLLIGEKIDEGCLALFSEQDRQLITMTYVAWEGVLTDLVAHGIEEINKGGDLKESLWRAKGEIEKALIGLQDERLARLQQGEG